MSLLSRGQFSDFPKLAENLCIIETITFFRTSYELHSFILFSRQLTSLSASPTDSCAAKGIVTNQENRDSF